LKKLLKIILLTSSIGFSQNCENSILDEISINENVNQYFQIALSLNLDDLSFLDDCDGDINYTMFAPGVDVPTASVAPLVGSTTDMIDLILHYIHEEELDFQTTNITGDFIMLDENYINIDSDPLAGFINDNVSILNHLSPICACNGVIYTIDNLIWPPNIGLDDELDQKISIYPVPTKHVLNVSGYDHGGILKIINNHGVTIYSQRIENHIEIDISNYRSGLYFIDFKSKHSHFTESVIIN